MLVEAESEIQWQRGIFVKQGSDGRVYSSGSPGLHSKRDAKQQMWSRMEDCTRGSSVLGRRVAGTGKYNQTAAQKLGTWKDGRCNNDALGDTPGMRRARG